MIRKLILATVALGVLAGNSQTVNSQPVWQDFSSGGGSGGGGGGGSGGGGGGGSGGGSPYLLPSYATAGDPSALYQQLMLQQQQQQFHQAGLYPAAGSGGSGGGSPYSLHSYAYAANMAGAPSALYQQLMLQQMVLQQQQQQFYLDGLYPAAGSGGSGGGSPYSLHSYATAGDPSALYQQLMLQQQQQQFHLDGLYPEAGSVEYHTADGQPPAGGGGSSGGGGDGSAYVPQAGLYPTAGSVEYHTADGQPPAGGSGGGFNLNRRKDALENTIVKWTRMTIRDLARIIADQNRTLHNQRNTRETRYEWFKINTVPFEKLEAERHVEDENSKIQRKDLQIEMYQLSHFFNKALEPYELEKRVPNEAERIQFLKMLQVYQDTFTKHKKLHTNRFKSLFKHLVEEEEVTLAKEFQRKLTYQLMQEQNNLETRLYQFFAKIILDQKKATGSAPSAASQGQAKRKAGTSMGGPQKVATRQQPTTDVAMAAAAAAAPAEPPAPVATQATEHTDQRLTNEPQNVDDEGDEKTGQTPTPETMPAPAVNAALLLAAAAAIRGGLGGTSSSQ
jgi:hypothetical protein